MRPVGRHFKNNLIFVFVPRSDLLPGCSGYEWIQAGVCGFGGVLMCEYDNKGVVSIGTRKAFG